MVLALLQASERQKWEVRALAVLAALVVAVLMYRMGSFVQGSFGSAAALYGSLGSRADSLIVGAALAYLWIGGRIPYRCPTAVSLVAWAVFGVFVVFFTLGEPFFFEWGWTATAICGALTTYSLWSRSDMAMAPSHRKGVLRAVPLASPCIHRRALLVWGRIYFT
jgi:peptidoglycan/LPS O-acetylase OafA/YrhL